MSGAFDPDLLVRVEEAGINASAPREQLWIDGWLVRFSPGKAKRARCIQAVAAGRQDLEARLRRCLAVYADAGLRPYVRITPFSEPVGLDEQLAALGMEAIDDTRVMVTALPLEMGGAGTSSPLPPGIRFVAAGADEFARWIGRERGSSEKEQAAHAKRLRESPVRHYAARALDATGATVAGGQVAVEGELAGLYDVLTTPAARGRGIAEGLCRYLLASAAPSGAKNAYLQVDASNEVARRVYRRMGFEDAYSYHYRSPPAA